MGSFAVHKLLPPTKSTVENSISEKESMPGIRPVVIYLIEAPFNAPFYLTNAPKPTALDSAKQPCPGISMVQATYIQASGTYHLLPNGPMERFYPLA